VDRAAPPSRLRGLLVNLTLAVVSVTITVVVLEIVLRFAGFQTRGSWSELPYERVEGIGHAFKPGYQGTMYKGISSGGQEIPVSINSLGMRGPDMTKEKPPGTKRVLVVGDSFAFGYLLPNDASMPTLLEGLLDQKGLGDVQVINGGVPGFGIVDAAGLVEHRGLELQPDILVVAASPGDIADAGVRTDHDKTGGGSRVRIDRAALFTLVRTSAIMEFMQYLGFVGIHMMDPKLSLQSGLHAKVPPASIQEAWNRYAGPFGELAKSAREHDLPLVLLSYPGELELFSDNTTVRDRWKELAAENGVTFVDVLPAMKERRLDDLYLPADGHPSKLGNQIVAEKLADTIGLMLQGGGQPPRSEPGI
jgi:lysophospholipase L1-like esterase